MIRDSSTLRLQKPMHNNQIILLLFVLFLLCSFSNAVENDGCTTSCGHIVNITKPFRLKGDPKGCGDSNYELACINNRTILDIDSGQYYVSHIDYNNFTIRIADVGLRKGDCSSVPLRSLSCLPYKHQLGSYDCWEGPNGDSTSRIVVIVECMEAVDSLFYIDVSSCSDGIKSLNNSSTRRRVYAIIDPNVSYVETTCTVRLTAMISWWVDGNNLRSYAQIHEQMVYGFELSWFGKACHMRFKGCPVCDINSEHHIFCDAKLGVYLFLLITGWIMEMISLYGIEGFVVVKFILGAPCVMIFLIRRWRRRHLAMDQNVEEFLQSNNNFLPIRYSYSDIKKITGNLKDKLGEGGYGSVFKGRIRSGRDVAVKILKKGKTDGQDFINEVATIGRIYHVNVVGLIGFCIEGSKQALVYDYMHNGSLDKHIFSQGQWTSLGYKKVYEIALGVARGIEYLHQGCDMQILHFDIKPHNILLDRDFTPKVSDFGLARLYPTTYDTVSLTAAKGTLGYMAPELVYKNLGGVSYKADVYSFGKLLMEMASGRKNWEAIEECSSQAYFPLWVHSQLSEGLDVSMEQASEEDRRIVKKMIIVALWCIQLNPSNRPSMRKVLKMLEGEVDDLQIPPKPLYYALELSTRDDETWVDEDKDPISTSSTMTTNHEGSHLEYTTNSIIQV